MKIITKYSFLTLITCGVSSAWGHGLHDNGAVIADSPRPLLWWEYLISPVGAAMKMRIDRQSGYRYIEADGLADHSTGRFPNRGNPHSIERQDYNYRINANPEKAVRATSVRHDAFGVAINGVPFDAATAEFWSSWGGRARSGEWNYEALTGGLSLGLDRNNAHVQPNGAYHYHGQPIGILERLPYRTRPVLIGYAADGFPIYSHYGYVDASDASSGLKALKSSYRIKAGERPSGPGGRYDGRFGKDWEYVPGLGDLDRCNGRNGVTPEYPQGTYHYVITSAFPSIPRCWTGTPDPSFKKHRGSGGRGVGGGGGIFPDELGGPGGGAPQPLIRGGGPASRGGPPQKALDACSGRSDGAQCTFPGRRGEDLKGSCRTLRGGELACVPSHRPGRGGGGPR